MCTRYSLDLPVPLSAPDRTAIDAWPLVLDKIQLRDPLYNIAPSDVAPVIIHGADGVEVVSMRWGFVPSWSENGHAEEGAINAWIATLEKSKIYASALKRHRCLIPATGYYEWKGNKGTQQPFNVNAVNGSALFFAGLWSSWRNPENTADRPKLTFTIITGKPGLVSGKAYDRQPVIMPSTHWDAWLNHNDEHGLVMLESLPDTELAYYPVTTAVNNVRNQGRELIDAAGS